MQGSSDFKELLKKASSLAFKANILLMIATFILVILIVDPSLSMFQKQQTYVDIDEDKIENGIHIRTGFKEGKGLQEVINNCTNCHSSKLVIQNRMNEERWNATIKWMQETQNLWDLGENQKIIVDYLVANYPPIEKGRRATLQNIEWYELEN